MYEKELMQMITHNGSYYQKLKTIEELNELTLAIIQDTNKLKGNHFNIVEEIADVYVMLEQLKLIYGLSDEEIGFMVEYKIKRTLERINNESNTNKSNDNCNNEQQHCSNIRITDIPGRKVGTNR